MKANRTFTSFPKFSEWTLLNKVIKCFFRILAKSTLSTIQHPDKTTQQSLLAALIKKCRQTAFGQHYHFQQITSYEDFKTQVPIAHYEEFYEQWITRMLKGEKNLTYPGEIFAFARTGGTTSKKEKYLPLTRDALYRNQLFGPFLLFLCYLQANPHSQLFTGKTITISGGFTTNPFTGTGKVGFISGILQQATPALMKKFKAPSEKIALLTDRESKVQCIIQTTKTTNITGIAGIPLWASHCMKTLSSSNRKLKTSVKKKSSMGCGVSQ